MDWGASGIANSFEYELLDPFCTHSLGFADSVKSCRITEGYYTDAKYECEIETDGGEWPEHASLRVWHTAELDGETYRECLGTFIEDTVERAYRNGRECARLHMMSPLDRFATDRATHDYAVLAGWSIANWIKQVVEDARGTCAFSPSIDFGRPFPTDWVWEFGDSVLKGINKAADFLGAQIGCDRMGRVTVEPYVPPKSRSIAYEFAEGEASIVLPEVSRTLSAPLNRVGVKAELDGVTYYAEARVPATHPFHWTRIGRHSTEVYDESQLLNPDMTPEECQRVVDERAAYCLDLNNSQSVKWKARCLYVPLDNGQVCTVPHSAGGRALGMQVSREYECTATMEVEFECADLEVV